VAQLDYAHWADPESGVIGHRLAGKQDKGPLHGTRKTGHWLSCGVPSWVGEICGQRELLEGVCLRLFCAAKTEYLRLDNLE
jgi:hypothetical protein